MTMLYYGQLILFSNELGPVNTNEMMFIFLAMLISIFWQIKVFGEIAVLWDTWSQESQKWQSKLDGANETMRLCNLDDSLQNEIRDFILLTKSTRERSE